MIDHLPAPVRYDHIDYCLTPEVRALLIEFNKLDDSDKETFLDKARYINTLGSYYHAQ